MTRQVEAASHQIARGARALAAVSAAVVVAALAAPSAVMADSAPQMVLPAQMQNAMDKYAHWFYALVFVAVFVAIIVQGLGVFRHAITKGSAGTSQHPNQPPANFAKFAGEMILIGVMLVIAYSYGITLINDVLAAIWSLGGSAPSATPGPTQ